MDEVIADLKRPLQAIAGAVQALKAVADTGEHHILQAVDFVADGLDETWMQLIELQEVLERQAALGGDGYVIVNETVTIDAKSFQNCHMQVDHISDTVAAIAEKLASRTGSTRFAPRAATRLGHPG
jgi:hypothetical protein